MLKQRDATRLTSVLNIMLSYSSKNFLVFSSALTMSFLPGSDRFSRLGSSMPLRTTSARRTASGSSNLQTVADPDKGATREFHS